MSKQITNYFTFAETQEALKQFQDGLMTEMELLTYLLECGQRMTQPQQDAVNQYNALPPAVRYNARGSRVTLADWDASVAHTTTELNSQAD